MIDKLLNFAYGLGFYVVFGGILTGLSWLLYKGVEWLLNATGLTVVFEHLFWAFIGIGLLGIVFKHLYETGKDLRRDFK